MIADLCLLHLLFKKADFNIINAKYQVSNNF